MDSSCLARLLENTQLNIIDIGARGGLMPTFAPIANHVNVVGFEPDQDECDRLNAQLRNSDWHSARVLPQAVGETRKDRTFYVARSPSVSSFFRPDLEVIGREVWATVETLIMDTIALDDLIVAGELSGDQDFLKIDTQGTELEILQSGQQKLLEQLLGIEVEVEFVPLYHDQPLFSEVELFLRNSQFTLLRLDQDFMPSPYPLARPRSTSGNALFLRGKTWARSRPPNDPCLKKLVVIYLVYGLYREAFELVKEDAPQLVDGINQCYAQIKAPSVTWRLHVLRQTLLMILRPTAKRRKRLVNTIRQVVGPDHVTWTLD